MRGAILAEQEKNRKYEKARTDMIAGISHDLRTPLTAIRGIIKGLLDGVASTPERQKKFLETAYRRTGDMDLLLNQLFYLSKLETGNMPFDSQTIEISIVEDDADISMVEEAYLEAAGFQTVMVHINRIREKIEDNSRNPKILETVWEAGYRFNKSNTP